MSDEVSELNSAQAYAGAQAYASTVAEIPSSFTETLRALLTDSKGDNSLSSASTFLLQRLLKSPKLNAMFREFGVAVEKELPANGDAQALAHCFSPLEAAGILTASFLFRKLSRLATNELAQEYLCTIPAAADMGSQLGVAIPQLGPEVALLACVMPPMARTLLAAHNEKAFREYRRHLKSTKMDIDLQFELKTWGCTAYNVASSILVMFSWGTDKASALSLGLSASPSEGSKLNDDAYRFFLASTWSNALVATGKEPPIAHRGEYYPTREAMDRLLGETARIKSGSVKVLSSGAEGEDSEA